MLRALIFTLLTLLASSFSPIYADSSAPATSPQIMKLQQLQNTITTDIAALSNTDGEMKQFMEYRVKQHATQAHMQIKLLMADTNTDNSSLLPFTEQHLAFINQIDHYFSHDIERFKLELSPANGGQLMSNLANRESERDQFLKGKLETLNWLTSLNQDISEQKSQLIEQLLQRSDLLNSLVKFTQAQLQTAIGAVTNAGADVSSEQTTLVAKLKERLALTKNSLSVVIELLDQLGQDTSVLKQTLFSISGDITQDVLNIDVAGELLSQWWVTAKNQAIENGPSMAFKIFIFLLIIFLASLAGKATQRIVKKTVSTSKFNFSQLLQDFFISLSSKVVFAIGLMIALSQLGFELGPLLAGFGVAGVIIGFALQDTLSNFASGMMILIYRPYDVGDLISAAGVTGKVSQMSLVSTTIKTLDNQRLIIPNNKIWGDTINNITVEHQRRVDMTFGIGYSDDIPKTEKVLNEIINKHPKVLKYPEPTVKLHLLNESSVDFIVRPWVKPEDYWDVYWDVTREVKMRFDRENISIPFPQRDLHIYQTKAD